MPKENWEQSDQSIDQFSSYIWCFVCLIKRNSNLKELMETLKTSKRKKNKRNIHSLSCKFFIDDFMNETVGNEIGIN